MIVPFEASGKRLHEAIADNSLALIGPHGFNATTPGSSTACSSTSWAYTLRLMRRWVVVADISGTPANAVTKRI